MWRHARCITHDVTWGDNPRCVSCKSAERVFTCSSWFLWVSPLPSCCHHCPLLAVQQDRDERYYVVKKEDFKLHLFETVVISNINQSVPASLTLEGSCLWFDYSNFFICFSVPTSLSCSSFLFHLGFFSVFVRARELLLWHPAICTTSFSTIIRVISIPAPVRWYEGMSRVWCCVLSGIGRC